MTLIEAKAFVGELLEKVIPQGQVERLGEFYHQDVVGHFREETFCFSDIENRIRHLGQHVDKYLFVLEEIVLIDDLIFFRVKQTWLTKQHQTAYHTTIAAVYRIRQNKIVELWILPDADAKNYKEVNQDFIKGSENQRLDEKDKQEFLERLNLSQYFYRQQKVDLTAVEQECLYYYLRGFSAKETALKMGLSYRTIQTYISHINEKYGSTSKLDLRRKLFPDGPMG